MPNNFFENLPINELVVVTRSAEALVRRLNWLTNSNNTPPVTNVAILLKSILFKASLNEDIPSEPPLVRNNKKSLTTPKISLIGLPSSTFNFVLSNFWIPVKAPINFVDIHLIPFCNPLTIPENTLFTVSPRYSKGLSVVHRTCINSKNPPTRSWSTSLMSIAAILTPSKAYSNTPLCFINWLSTTRASPIDAVISRRLPFNGMKIPTTCHSALPKNLTVCHPISTTAKKPAKVLWIFLAISSPIMSFWVKSLKTSVIWYKFSAVLGGNIWSKALDIGLSAVNKAITEFLRPCIMFSRPLILDIFLANSSAESVPDSNASRSANNWVFVFSVYPAFSSSTPERVSIDVDIFSRVFVNMSPVSQFPFIAFSMEPVSLIILSISIPVSLATLAKVSPNIEVSSMPSFMNCFQPLPRPPVSKSFRISDNLLIVEPKTSFIPDHKSLPSLKSPNIISNVCAQPEPTDSFNVAINFVKVVTWVAALDARLPISVVSSA